jgi:hypothetical protein
MERPLGMVTVKHFSSSADALLDLRRLESEDIDAVILHPDVVRPRTELRVAANDLDRAKTLVGTESRRSRPDLGEIGWNIVHGIVVVSAFTSLIGLMLHVTGGAFRITVAGAALILVVGGVIGALRMTRRDELYRLYFQKPRRERVAEYAARIAFLRNSKFSEVKDEWAGVIAQDAIRCVVEVGWGEQRPPESVYYLVDDRTGEACPLPFEEAVERWGAGGYLR